MSAVWSDEENAARLAKAFRDHPKAALDRAWSLMCLIFGAGFIFGALSGAVVVLAWASRT